MCFQSKAELERYTFLRGLEVYGVLSGLEYQYRCPLHAINRRGEKIHVGYYIADFVFRLNNRQIIEDLKGKGLAPDALSSWKIKHFEAEYGQKIEIIHNPKIFYD